MRNGAYLNDCRLAALSTVAATAAFAQTAAPMFDANAAAALQDLLNKADAQNIRVVPQPQGLVVNGRMIGYSGPGENIVGMSAEQILEWRQRDLGGGKFRWFALRHEAGQSVITKAQ